jgi:transposase
MNTTKRLISDELWRIVEPLLPIEPSKARGGRPCRLSQQRCNAGVEQGLAGKYRQSRSGPERLNVACCQSLKVS